AELDPLGHGRERGEHREQRRKIPVGGSVVLAHPGGVEPERLRVPNHLQGVAVFLGERSGGRRRNLPGEETDGDANAHVAAKPTQSRARGTLPPDRGSGGVVACRQASVPAPAARRCRAEDVTYRAYAP